jgi:murein L,D-transpeptidase YcbB/YkuD
MIEKFVHKGFAAGVLLLILVGGACLTSFAQPTEVSLPNLLRIRIEDGGVPLKTAVGNEPIHAAIVLPIFYERRAYQLAWTDGNGPLPQTHALLEAVKQADREGLRPGDYHLEKIETILSEFERNAGVEKTPEPHLLVDLDLLLTDAFLIYGAHLVAGRVNPQKIYPQWFAHRREADLARLLEAALNSNRVTETIAALLPDYAGFHLDVVEHNQLGLNMRVVVGKTYRKTPVFSDKITYLVINPYWGVPDSIARNDILPRIKKEPSYLVSQKIRVFEGAGGNAREIQAHTIDWRSISANKLPYRFKQDPGPHNALGRIKFMFPNQFNVYLHDTPMKALFGKARRDFSSGCIRVERPVELAQYLLRDHPGWPPEKIRSVLSLSDFSPMTIALADPINIHIQYWTSWIGENGRIHFRPDIYDRDAVLDAAVQQLPPGTRKQSSEQ